MPIVSVIVPCYNEQETIGLLLQAMLDQSYPTADMEVVIADGMSKDATRERIAEFQSAHPELTVRVVDNPTRHIPAALNILLDAAQGEFIVRLDAHSVPVIDYVRLSVEALEAGHGDNVGGVWDIVPNGPGGIARSIATAAGHRLGVGDAQYRHTNKAQYVDTVPFGAFRSSLIDKIGGFREDLLANEDYEFNARIIKSGGRIWLDPRIRCNYYSRKNLRLLSKQYYNYGYWKARMLADNPDTLRWRQAIPPLFVLSLVGLGLWSFIPLFRWLLVLEVTLYVGVLLIAGILAALKKGDAFMVIGVPLAIATMHLSWGTGLLVSGAKSLFGGGSRKR